MAAAKNNSNGKVYGVLSLVFGLVLVVGGLCAWKAGSALVKDVNAGLVAEKMYFPPEGSPGFDPAVFPDAQAYAGQQVVDGPTARVYAEDFLGVQYTVVGNGKVLAEVGNELAMDPTNAELKQQYDTMSELSTGSTLLLVAGYGAWVQGDLLQKGGMGALVVGTVLVVLGGVCLMRAKRA